MDKERRTIRVSTSIENFRDRLVAKYPEYSIWSWRERYQPAIFFGMYTPLDYVRFLLHRGRRTVFWCGSDIKKLKGIWRILIAVADASHWCENNVEAMALARLGIFSAIQPMFFHNASLYFPHEYIFKDVRKSAYISIRKGREAEYGLPLFTKASEALPDMDFHVFGVDGQDTENLFFYGHVENWKFDFLIQSYHCSVRLNHFDGFSELTAKSVLLGQYALSRIPYPHIETVDENTLITKLKLIRLTQEPNYESRNYWHPILCNKIEA